MAGFDTIPGAVVKDSVFDVEIEFEVPENFWDVKEPAYDDPAQRLFWEEARIVRENWLERFHWALRKSGWPIENIDASYSYFEDAVQNPNDGEEEARTPAMRFHVSIPGTWLIRNPDFFEQFIGLAKKGLKVTTKGREKPFRLDYWRITAEGGDLGGEAWEGSHFVVTQRREDPGYRDPLAWFPRI
jgi:hypothetical protein